MSVQAGDVIGFRLAAPGFCASLSGPDYMFQSVSGDPAPGSTVALGPPANARLDVSALLEPDCDDDGFGDETQDSDISSCFPETTISQGPKDKTKKKTATFEFSANVAGATFDCSLDGGPFAPCTSPHSVKVKRGRHSLQVRATAKGFTDASPATDDWKVKKKKKK